MLGFQTGRIGSRRLRFSLRLRCLNAVASTLPFCFRGFFLFFLQSKQTRIFRGLRGSA